MANPTLLVPIDVSALAINAYMLNSQPFRRWEINYRNLNNFKCAEPDPSEISAGFTNTTGKFTIDDPNCGVYLHWQLPEALRHGLQNPKTRAINFAYAPNRWLIVRFSGPLNHRKLKAFVVESDGPGNTEQNPSTYAFDPEIINTWQKSSDPVRQSAAQRLQSERQN